MKSFTRLAVTSAAAMAISATTMAADVTIRLGHLWPAVAGPHTKLLTVWEEKVEAESNGRIAVEIYPSGTLAAPPAQYDAVKNRIMDATATVLGYSANRFPLTQVVELPGVQSNAVNGSCIVQSLYDNGALDSEFTDTHPLFFFTHGSGGFHNKGEPIVTPSDLKGLRMRRPTTVVANILEELGAQPVGMAAPESYTSMQRGVIDGVALPWEGALSFRLNELAESHTEIEGLYTLTFIVTMNKQVYNSLPADLKEVIDNNSGMEWANKAGVLFDELDSIGRKQAVDAGHNIVTIEGGTENPVWKTPIVNARKAYLDDLQGKGLPARDVYNQAVALAASCGM